MGAETLIMLTVLSGWPELPQETHWPTLPPPVLIAPVPDSLLPPSTILDEVEADGPFLP
jgi:hypothetical protein